MSSAPVSSTPEHPASTASQVPVKQVNFDAQGNSRISQLGRSAYAQALEDGWADFRRLHAQGRKARRIYDASRETVASILGVRTEEIHFAPSATAAFHNALGALSLGRSRVGNTAVVGSTERSAVLNAARHYAQPSIIPVTRLGSIDLDQFTHAVSTGSVAWALSHVGNHEVGTLQDVEQLARVSRASSVPFVLDAAASVGHIALPAAEHWDALVAQPSDWGGGNGVGVLALKARTRTRSIWPEDQDLWFPGGTSLPAVFAAAVTLEESVRAMEERSTLQRRWIDQIRDAAAQIPDVEVVGDPNNRLPHILTFSCLYVDGEALTTELDKYGFSVGSGSACTSATLEPSHVLAAMGVLTHGNVRISLDWDVTQDDVDRFISVLPRAVASVRALMGVDDL